MSGFRSDRPLDALIPGLHAPPPDKSFLELPLPTGLEWIIPIDEHQGGPAALHHRVAQLIEAAMLSALATPPGNREDLGREVRRVRLFIFTQIEGDLFRALAAFALRPDPPSGDEWREVFAALDAKGPPESAWSAEVDAASSPIGIEVRRLHQALVDDTLEPWGAEPGRPADRLLHLLSDLGGRPMSTALEAIDLAESLLISKKHSCIRWLPPLVFQALCDLVGVAASRDLGAEIEWAVSETETDGFTPPPLFRVGEQDHVPIALHLLRWWVMPLRAGEEVPPLSAWVRDQFSR
jgi:hypothetical protein